MQWALKAKVVVRAVEVVVAHRHRRVRQAIRASGGWNPDKYHRRAAPAEAHLNPSGRANESHSSRGLGLFNAPNRGGEA